MGVDEAWQRFLALDRYGSGDAQGSFVYALHAQAAGRDLALAAHDERCQWCAELGHRCKEGARLEALPGEAGEGEG